MFLFVDVMEYGVKLIFIVDVNKIFEFFFLLKVLEIIGIIFCYLILWILVYDE